MNHHNKTRDRLPNIQRKQTNSGAVWLIYEGKAIGLLDTPEIADIMNCIRNMELYTDLLGIGKRENYFKLYRGLAGKMMSWYERIQEIENRERKSIHILMPTLLEKTSESIEKAEKTWFDVSVFVSKIGELSWEYEKHYPANYDLDSKLETLHYSARGAYNERTIFWRGEKGLEFSYADRLREFDGDLHRKSWNQAWSTNKPGTAWFIQSYLSLYVWYPIELRWVMDQVAPRNGYNYLVYWYRKLPDNSSR